MKKVFIIIFISITSFVSFIWYEIGTLSKTSNELIIFRQSDCNLKLTSCKLDFDDELGKISISPRPFYLNEKISVSISFKEKKNRHIEMDLKGLDMDMGYNRFKLKTSDDLSYNTTFNLPTCTKDYMPWIMAIYKNKDTINTYKFLAEKRKL